MSHKRDISFLKNKKKGEKKPSQMNDDLVKVENQEFSESETKVLNDSFNLIKNLNSHISKVEKGKEKLENDLKHLNSKIENHETIFKSGFQSKFFLNLKEEIIKEFTPLLEKTNFKPVKIDIFKEIGEIIDIEVKKLRTEINSVQNFVGEKYDKSINSFENKLIRAIKENENLKKEFSKFKQEELEKLMANFEKKSISVIEKHNNSLRSTIENLIKNNSVDIGLIKGELALHKSNSLNFDKEIHNIKKNLDKFTASKEMDLSSILSKLSKLETENSSIKSLIEKYEDELFNRAKNESLDIEEKVKSELKKVEEGLKEIASDKTEIEKFVLDKINGVIFDYEGFQKKIKEFENNEKNFLEENFNEKLVELKTLLLENFQKDKLVLEKDLDEKMKISIHDFSEKGRLIEEDLDRFKGEISSLIKNHVHEFNVEISDLKDYTESSLKSTKNLENTFEELINQNLSKFKLNVENEKKNIEKLVLDLKTVVNSQENFVLKKINEVIDKFNDFSKKQEKEFDDRDIALKENSKKIFDKFSEELKEDISRNILKLNEELSRFRIETKEGKQKFEEDLDLRFLNLKEDISEKLILKYKHIDDKFFAKEVEIKTHFENILEKEEDLKANFGEYQIVLDQKYLNFEDKVKSDFSSFRTEFEEISLDLKSDFNNFQNELNFNLNKFKDDFVLESTSFKNHIEDNFSDLTLRLEDNLSKKEEEFNVRISSKEEDFVSVLDDISKEKKEFHEYLNIFHKKLEAISKDTHSKVEKSLDDIANEKLYFEDKKKEINTNVDSLFSVRKLEFEDLSKQLDSELKDLIHDEKNNYRFQENDFRVNFNLKISNLYDLIKSKLSDIEDRFLSDSKEDLKKVSQEEKKNLEFIAEDLKLQADSLSKRVEAFDSKEKDFLVELESERIKLNEKIELRLTELEKNFNKRFLDYNLEFSSLKNVLIDEVEDLISDVTTCLKTETSNFTSNLKTLETINDQASKRIQELTDMEKGFREEISFIRNDFNDFKTKIDFFEPLKSQALNLNEHVMLMNEYETQLFVLIKNLKKRGVSNVDILHALTSKGHPRVYLSILINDFETLDKNSIARK